MKFKNALHDLMSHVCMERDAFIINYKIKNEGKFPPRDESSKWELKKMKDFQERFEVNYKDS